MTEIAPYPVEVRITDFAQFAALLEALVDLLAAAEDEHPDECREVRAAVNAFSFQTEGGG